MRLLQLKYFVETCNSGSFSQASKVLFVTQPALSTAISNLETEFGIKLFNRTRYTLTLTKEGEIFYERAKILLDSLENFEKDMKDIANNVVTIRVGVPPMIGSFLFPTIYNRYVMEHVGAHFEIWEDGSLNIRKKILNRGLDIGFSILNESEHEQYNRYVMLETELEYCVSVDNPLSKKQSITIEDIKDEPVVMMKEGFYQTRLINNMYREIEAEPNIVVVSSQISVLRNFVKMNLGGAFLIRELIDKDDKTIVGIPFTNPIVIKIGLLWQKNIELSSNVQEFIQYIKNVQL
ncbi:MAG: LysR family transcriptional regulator [Candidatus Izemoplasmatales bacterium]